MLHHKFFEMNWFNKFEDKWNGLSSTILIILGNLIYAFSINLLITPMHLYNGGFLGISQIVRHLIVANTGVRTIYGLDFTGIIYFLINIPLFLYAYSSAGFKFATKTLISIGISSVCLTLVPVPKIPYIDDYLTACVVAGVIGGIGTGMILRGGSSTGGPDIIAVCMAKKNPNVSVGMLNNVVNFAVYGCCLLLFNVKIAVYSFIYSAIKAMFIDRMHTQNIKTEVLIITKKEGIEKILTEELRELNFGIFEGKTYEEIKNEYPDKVEEMRNDWRNFKVDKGESINEMMLRTAKKMDEIISGHKDKKILVVAHAGVIQALISYYLFGNLDGYWKFRIDNGSMTKMHIMEDGYTYFEYINLTQ